MSLDRGQVRQQYTYFFNFCVRLVASRWQRGDNVLDILKKHLDPVKLGCTVNQWISTLSDEEQKAFAALKANQDTINTASLFSELNAEEPTPFKLTAFRSHIRGYCTCPKN